jgi:hypothetical protein
MDENAPATADTTLSAIARLLVEHVEEQLAND